MRRILADEALDILFRAAGERHRWLPRPLSDTILRAIWELVRFGPTSSRRGGSARLVFVRSDAAKARLAPALPAAERAALTTAPCAAILACPTPDDTAAMPLEGGLCAAYLILAARALGLDCAPLWHFDPPLVDRAFFPDGEAAAQFLCLLGYAEPVPAAEPKTRPGRGEMCQIL